MPQETTQPQTPALDVPPEILKEIFPLCLPEEDHERLHPNSAPLLLCKICSSWRSVALSMPVLWDTIIFPPATSARGDRNLRKWMRFIKQGNIERWFDRTLMHPGHLLSFGEAASPNPRKCLTMPSLIKMISRDLKRFTHLAVVLTEPEHYAELHGQVSEHDCSELRSASICCTGRISGWPPFTYFPFSSAPKLESVLLVVSRDAPFETMLLPWERLTRVTINNPLDPLDVGSLRNLVHICPNLQYGAFGMEPLRAEPWPSDITPIVLPSQLATLKYILHPPDSPQQPSTLYSNLFGRHIDCKDVKHLHLQYPTQEDVMTKFSDHAAETFPKLESLTLESHGLSSIPAECIRIAQYLLIHPNSLPTLTLLTLPYPENHMKDIVRLLQSRTSLSVIVDVVKKGMGEPATVQRRIYNAGDGNTPVFIGSSIRDIPSGRPSSEDDDNGSVGSAALAIIAKSWNRMSTDFGGIKDWLNPR